jgi:hypothetical protein
MKTQSLLRVFGMILLAVAVSLVVLALVAAIQSPARFVSVGWNF